AVPPKTRNAMKRVATFGASAGSSSAAHQASISRRIVGRLRKRCVSLAINGMTATAPIDGAIKARPSAPGPACTWSAIQGMRVAKVPDTAPCTANMRDTATRADRTSAATHPKLVGATYFCGLNFVPALGEAAGLLIEAVHEARKLVAG